jgi:hypothetical protein
VLARVGNSCEAPIRDSEAFDGRAQSDRYHLLTVLLCEGVGEPPMSASLVVVEPRLVKVIS